MDAPDLVFRNCPEGPEHKLAKLIWRRLGKPLSFVNAPVLDGEVVNWKYIAQGAFDLTQYSVICYCYSNA